MIRVRVKNVWSTLDVENGEGLSFMVVDDEGTRMHAFVEHFADAKRFKRLLQQGDWFTITGFSVVIVRNEIPSQADQVCYIPYPYVSKPRKCWLNVLKVNPRANILGNYKDKEPTLLQQENDDDVSTTNEDIIIDSLVIREHPTEEIDFDVGDAQGEDEFQCNISSSDEDEYDEDGDEDEDVDHTY
ncbi:unnamed protein product [Microthlaspi erraticum]|uniref:Replication protein A 70 kDa DNA-binding subunit B/D first OB fold domain-containing protein n=1 Tax=Microthlaspi erraticum TaxID=1685480 RepID=A0A6D2JDB2_9BRAS|nr:unnamed protein product [Microthlaspi erraticum]